jgi:hypothetical protein
MADRVKTAELARILGISRQRVNELSRKGKLTRGTDGGWDPDKARAELGRTLEDQQERRSKVETPRSKVERGFPVREKVERAFPPRDPETVDLPMSGSTHDIFNRARAAKEIAIAKERQLQLRRRQGELLEAAEVELAWTRKLTSFKNRLLGLPDKMASRLAACSDVLECRALLDGELRSVLNALSENKADAE